MKTVRILRIGCILLTGVLLCAAVAGLSGCTWFQKVEVSSEDARGHRDKLRLFKDGMSAFQDGKYREAQRLFDSLSHESGDKSLRRKALYGAACTSLTLARNEDELNEAMEQWDAWRRLSTQQMGHEDPRMLNPLLERFAALYLRSTSTEETRKSDQAQKHKKLIEEKDKEIQNLKNQLEALEAIHQEMEEKKKEVSSP